MEPETPEWLDSSFLAAALQGVEGEGEGEGEPRVTVMKFSAELAVPPGNNYLSHVYRVAVDYCTDQDQDQDPVHRTSLMVKAPITRGIVVDMSDKMDLLSMEPRIYRELLPRIQGKVSDHQFAPKSYYCSDRLPKGLVLQDLNEEGYILSDRFKQLNYSHCKVALTALAKFHAASVSCYNDDPEFVKTIGKERLYTDNGFFSDQFKGWMAGAVQIIAGIVSDKEGCKDSVDFFVSRAEHLAETAIELCKPREVGLNVLNHGDFWMSNMLFKHGASGEATDVKFLDFQIVRYAPPVLDLIYFFWSSANEEVRFNKRDQLFDAYLETLNSTLEALECEERYTREEFESDLRKAADWAVLTICQLLPVVMCEPEDVMKSEDMKEEDFKDKTPDENEQFQKIYNGKRFREALPNAIRQFSSWIPK